jgi:hypothetical protein
VFGSGRLTGALLDGLTHHVYILQMNGDSYAETSAHQCTRLVADFSGWPKQKKVAKEEITPEHRQRYLKRRVGNQRPRRGDVAGLKQLFDQLFENVESLRRGEQLSRHAGAAPIKIFRIS